MFSSSVSWLILIYFSAFRRITIIHSLGLKYKGIWEFQVIFFAGKFQLKSFLINNEVDNIFEICGGFFSNIWSFGGKFYFSGKSYEERASYGTALCLIVFGPNSVTWSLQRDFSECCIEALEVTEDVSVSGKETQHIDYCPALTHADDAEMLASIKQYGRRATGYDQLQKGSLKWGLD